MHGLLTHTNIRIPINNKKIGDPPYPLHYDIFGGIRGVFSKISQTEAMEKADDIPAEVDDFKEASENHVEGCDVLKVRTEPGDFEALPLQTHHVQF